MPLINGRAIPHLTRYYMYKRICEAVYPIKGKILGISGIDYFQPMIAKDCSKIVETSYPEVDMQNLPFEDNQFDFVISDQVIEHLPDPQRAIDESWRVLKRGGIAIHCTVFMYPVHEGPYDYWRFSPDGLRYLCRNFSKILQCEAWGNRIAHLVVLFSYRYRFLPIPESKVSLRRFIATWNEKNYPLVAWIICRK